MDADRMRRLRLSDECRAIADLAADAAAGAVAAEGWRDARVLVGHWTGGNPAVIALVIGAAAAESDGFRILDTTPGPRVAMRDDGRLGNLRPGHGMRYRARGWLVDKGRDRYRRLAVRLGVALLASPELLSDPSVAWQAAAFRAHGRRDPSPGRETVADLAGRGNWGRAVAPFLERAEVAPAAEMARCARSFLGGE